MFLLLFLVVFIDYDFVIGELCLGYWIGEDVREGNNEEVGEDSCCKEGRGSVGLRMEMWWYDGCVL